MKVYVKDSELKRKIISSGHSITSFADGLNITRTHIYNIINQRVALSPELAKRIAAELSTEFNELFFVGTQDEYEQLKEVKSHVKH